MATNNVPTPKNNSLVPTVDKLTGVVYKVSSEGLLLLSSQDSLSANPFDTVSYSAGNQQTLTGVVQSYSSSLPVNQSSSPVKEVLPTVPSLSPSKTVQTPSLSNSALALSPSVTGQVQNVINSARASSFSTIPTSSRNVNTLAKSSEFLSASSGSKFNFGISSSQLGISIPQAFLYADPNPSKFSVPLPANFLSSTGEFISPKSNTVINVNYTGFTPQAQTAFQFAVDIWKGLLYSPVPITVDASFAFLETGVLGSASSITKQRDFTGASQAKTWYPVALANSLAGTDLDTTQSDIKAQFSSRANWYYGTGAVPAGQYSFVTVVLHELGHGLGFSGLMNNQAGTGSWGEQGLPSIYDRFTENRSGQSLINTSLFPNPSIALGSQLTSNNIFFDGANANAANGGNRVKLYAPSTWFGGSSYSHLDETTFNNTPNALMTPVISPGESILNPGAVTLGLFKDMGWRLAGSLPVITVVATDTSAAETAIGITTNPGRFTLTRTGETTSALTVNVLMSGTATNGTDYTNIPRAATFAVGSTTTVVNLNVIDDDLVERTETAILTVGAGIGYNVGQPSTATVNIADNDVLPVITVVATDANAAETAIGITPNPGQFTLTRTGTTTSELIVSVLVSGTATNGTDYTNIPRIAIFAVGSTTAVVNLNVIDDTLVEGTETATLTVISDVGVGVEVGYTVGTPSSATVSIADKGNGVLPVITVVATDAIGAESVIDLPGRLTLKAATGIGIPIPSDPGQFTLTRTGATTSALTVNVLMSGTATNGTDYLYIPTTATFEVGSATALVDVRVFFDDKLVEGTETAILTVATGVGYTVGTTSSATVSIIDSNAALPVITVEATDGIASERRLDIGLAIIALPNPGQFTLTRTGAIDSELIVNVLISGTATNGTDYIYIPTTATFAMGYKTAVVNVDVIDDYLVEGTETAILTVATGTGYTVGTTSSATVSIIDSSVALPVITVVATDAIAAETAIGITPNPGQFTLTRTGATTSALTVNVLISGTATNGTDYTNIPTTATFAVGSATAVVNLNVIDDSLEDGTERAILTVGAGTGYTVGTTPSATISIADNDTPSTNIFFYDSFADNNNGWTLGTEWEIGSAKTSLNTGGTAFFPDPEEDNTPTSDNGVAGVVIGGNASIIPHDFYYLTSPVIDTSTANKLVFEYARWLNSDYAPYMENTVDLFDGSRWRTLWSSGDRATTDGFWTPEKFYIDSYKSASTQIRFGIKVGRGGYTVSSWNIDDVRLYNDGTLPVITVAATDGSAAETAIGITPNPGQFTLTRTGATTSALTVNVSMSQTLINALNGTDYTYIPTTATFAAGSTTAVVNLNVIDDSLAESTETAILTVGAGTGYTVGTTSSATVSIADNDIPSTIVTLSVSPTSVLESGTTNLIYTFTRSGGLINDFLPVTFYVTGTATFNTDYILRGATSFTGTTGIILFGPNSSTATLIVDPTVDTIIEGDETVALTLASETGYTIGTTSAVTGTILNNDYPTDILLTKKPASGNLPNGTLLGNFSSVDPDAGDTFTYSLVTGNGDKDNSKFTIVGNQLKTNAPFDTANEFDYSIRVRTTDQGSLFYEKQISIKNLQGDASGDVHFVTFDGRSYDQQSFGDFILVKSTVDNWQIQTRQEPWGQNSNVSINDGFATKLDGRTVIFDKDFATDKKLKIDGSQVTLISGESRTIGNSKIERQDNKYTLTYAGADRILATADDDKLLAWDGGDHVNLRVLPSYSRVSLLQGFLGNGDGLPSNDFALRNGTLLPSNPTWQQLHGEYADSWRVRQGESLFDTPSPYAPSPPQITLNDFPPDQVKDAIAAALKLGIPDEALNGVALDLLITRDQNFASNAANQFSPKLSITSSSVAEGNSGSRAVRLFVNLSIPSTRTVTVDYATQDGTGNTIKPAITGSDYTATSGKLTFLPGTTALTLDIPILGDQSVEFDEIFTVNLTNPYGAILGNSKGIVKILDDDLNKLPTFVGTSGNDIFTGGNGNDVINGREGDDSLDSGAGNDILNGGSGKDTLTGGTGADTFLYSGFTDSLFANPDRIRSFNPGEGDRLHLPNTPSATFNAGIISAANLTAAVTAAYADANPTVIGAQALAANQAVFFSFGATASTRRTYLAVNDSNPGYNSVSDLLIEVTGIVGTLPSGSLASKSYFI